jgi:hypothetical protein
MRYDKQHLLSLIPSIYRVRDYLREDPPHGPLEALIEAIADQIGGLELDIEQLYDDLFIETCADWVVPYIGDMIGYQPLRGATAAVSSPRAEVANTIGYRRRKGTLTVLETLADDVTGWAAVATESYTQLAQTQHMHHLRPARTFTFSVRHPLPSLADRGLFLDLPRIVDVRRIGSGRGVWNIPNVAIHLHRIEASHVTGGDAAAVDAAHPERFTFHPLGLDMPLFQPDPERPSAADRVRAALPQDVPAVASRRLLFGELQRRRVMIAAGQTADFIEEQAVGFSAKTPVVAVSVGGVSIDPQFLQICDLSQWTGSTLAGIRASIDPVLGRLVLADDPAGARVSVDYWQGSPGPFGAGAYPRTDPVSTVNVAPTDDLAAAITAALAAPAADVRVGNSATYGGDLTMALAANQKLTLRAGSASRPVVDGAITVNLGDKSELTLIGFVVADGLVVTGAAGAIKIQQCTVRPAAAATAVSWQGSSGGSLAVARSLLGPVRVDPRLLVEVSESAVDAGADANAAIDSSVAGVIGAILSLDRVTVIGTVRVREIRLVQNSLITGLVSSTRTQHGCVRFTYLPRASVTPHRYECQPESAARRAVAAAGEAGATAAQIAAADAAAIARVRPDFTSLDNAHPAYAQLGARCAVELRGGAEDGSEMGMFWSLQQIHKENNLRKRLAEYLRIGLEVGVRNVS